MTNTTPLLVPIPVQALLVNSLVQNDPNHQFQRWTPVYSSMNEFLDPIPAPFDNVQQDPPTLGVHLHWKLPAAMTHGQGQDTQQVTFPFTPNRWIVVRYATTANATTAAAMTAWIIESDYLNDDDGSTPFANPFTSTSGNVKPTMLGRSVSITEWEGEAGGPMFLRPTGLADVTFTAYQPGLDDVFAFSDDTTKLAENTVLTYLVAGWYSDPTQDPLAKYTTTQLDWTVLGTATPDTTVVHGMVYGLNWQTSVIPPRIDSDPSIMQVSVAQTSVDALAAIIATNAGQPGPGLQTKLEAFNYDLLPTLDDPDGMAQLELRIRDAWFGSTPGGTLWQIVPVSQAQTSEVGVDRAAIPTPPAITPDQADWLAKLNVAQRTLDTTRRQLATMQWEVFALWWKSQRISVIVNNPALSRQQRNWGINPVAIQSMINDALDATDNQSALSAVLALQTSVNTQAGSLPDPTSSDSIDDWTKKIPSNTQFMLRPTALPSFSQPADPVVLIAGLTPPTNDVDESVALPCRTVDAAVTGVNVGTNKVTASTGTLATIIQTPSSAKLATVISTALGALATECFFADPTNAASILKNGLNQTTGVSDLATAMGAGTAQISTIASPLQASFAFVAWQQAWAPVFLQWQLTWCPTTTPTPTGDFFPPASAQDPQNPGGGQDNWDFLAAPWKFDGGDDVTLRGSEYYQWTGGDPWTQSAPPAQTYTGRTFLTPHATFQLIRRLSDYVKLHPDDQDLNQIHDLIKEIGETRFMSQSLSGFNAAFTMRGLTHSSAPPANSPIATAVAGENRGVPMVSVGDQDFDYSGGTPFFQPVRGGYFQFERLQIVDAYGQVLNLMAANNNKTGTPSTFYPIAGTGLVPEPDSGIASPARRMRQAPRIVQPTRLEMRFLDADDDTKELFYAAGTNPVCGFVLPNHLDRSISAYDVAGNPLGELLVLVNDEGNQNVVWLPAPEVKNPITDPSEIANKHFSGILSAFTSETGGIPAAQRVDAFRAFYQSIDETLWMVDPPGGAGDRDLAALIGRPLAVVRAQIQFELYGQPATNQSWRDTLQNVDANITTVQFPIRLGSTELLDDGLIGYFTDDTYLTFDAVHPSQAATSPYVAPIAGENYLSLAFNYPVYSTQTLTMLIDPRATVYATTGILPAATLELPSQFYAAALAQMAVTFRAGPVLTDTDVIRVPFPAERQGTWSWIRRLSPAADAWEEDPIVAANAQPRLADAPPSLLDGWLRFTPRKGL